MRRHLTNSYSHRYTGNSRGKEPRIYLRTVLAVDRRSTFVYQIYEDLTAAVVVGSVAAAFLSTGFIFPEMLASPTHPVYSIYRQICYFHVVGADLSVVLRHRCSAAVFDGVVLFFSIVFYEHYSIINAIELLISKIIVLHTSRHLYIGIRHRGNKKHSMCRQRISMQYNIDTRLP